jgi:hypothetical protein
VEERRIAFRVHGEGAEAIPRLFIVFFSTSQTETTAGEPKNPTIRISSLLFVSVVDSIVIICFLFTLFVFWGFFLQISFLIVLPSRSASSIASFV